MIAVVLALVAALGGTAAAQERRPIPRDSVEVVVVGCLKGRVLKASEAREVDVQSGPVVRGRSFRLAAKGEVMDAIEEHDGHEVEAIGLVRRAAFDDPGWRVGDRVVIGGGPPRAGMRGIPNPADNVVVMDVSSIRMRASSCSVR